MGMKIFAIFEMRYEEGQRGNVRTTLRSAKSIVLEVKFQNKQCPI